MVYPKYGSFSKGITANGQKIDAHLTLYDAQLLFLNTKRNTLNKLNIKTPDMSKSIIKGVICLIR